MSAKKKKRVFITVLNNNKRRNAIYSRLIRLNPQHLRRLTVSIFNFLFVSGYSIGWLMETHNMSITHVAMAHLLEGQISRGTQPHHPVSHLPTKSSNQRLFMTWIFYFSDRPMLTSIDLIVALCNRRTYNSSESTKSVCLASRRGLIVFLILEVYYSTFNCYHRKWFCIWFTDIGSLWVNENFQGLCQHYNAIVLILLLS